MQVVIRIEKGKPVAEALGVVGTTCATSLLGLLAQAGMTTEGQAVEKPEYYQEPPAPIAEYEQH